MDKKTQMCSGNTRPRNIKKSREWSLTLWSEPEFNEKQFRYLVTGEEICPTTGKTHWQTYLYYYNAKSFDEVRNYFGKKNTHVELTKGEPKENVAYCTKDEKFKEYGELPQQGKRTDLADIADEIAKGKSVDAITLENPMLYHQYGRTLNKLEELAMMKLWRKEMTKCIWYYGPTGVGKSHKAFENYSNETHYVISCNDKGWWEGYRQQETVILNDFRGKISYEELLTLVDKWPYSVPRRGTFPMPFTSKLLIITSSLPPDKIYHNREAEDSLEQLYERIEVIKLKGKSKRVVTHKKKSKIFNSNSDECFKNEIIFNYDTE